MSRKMRDDFEVWAESQCMPIKTDGASYYYHRTSDAWEAWQGAYASLNEALINARKYVAFAFNEGIEGADQAGLAIDAAISSPENP